MINESNSHAQTTEPQNNQSQKVTTATNQTTEPKYEHEVNMQFLADDSYIETRFLNALLGAWNLSAKDGTIFNSDGSPYIRFDSNRSDGFTITVVSSQVLDPVSETEKQAKLDCFSDAILKLLKLNLGIRHHKVLFPFHSGNDGNSGHWCLGELRFTTSMHAEQTRIDKIKFLTIFDPMKTPPDVERIRMMFDPMLEQHLANPKELNYTVSLAEVKSQNDVSTCGVLVAKWLESLILFGEVPRESGVYTEIAKFNIRLHQLELINDPNFTAQQLANVPNYSCSAKVEVAENVMGQLSANLFTLVDRMPESDKESFYEAARRFLLTDAEMTKCNIASFDPDQAVILGFRIKFLKEKLKISENATDPTDELTDPFKKLDLQERQNTQAIRAWFIKYAAELQDMNLLQPFFAVNSEAKCEEEKLQWRPGTKADDDRIGAKDGKECLVEVLSKQLLPADNILVLLNSSYQPKTDTRGLKIDTYMRDELNIEPHPRKRQAKEAESTIGSSITINTNEFTINATLVDGRVSGVAAITTTSPYAGTYIGQMLDNCKYGHGMQSYRLPNTYNIETSFIGYRDANNLQSGTIKCIVGNQLKSDSSIKRFVYCEGNIESGLLQGEVKIYILTPEDRHDQLNYVGEVTFRKGEFLQTTSSKDLTNPFMRTHFKRYLGDYRLSFDSLREHVSSEESWLKTQIDLALVNRFEEHALIPNRKPVLFTRHESSFGVVPNSEYNEDEMSQSQNKQPLRLRRMSCDF